MLNKLWGSTETRKIVSVDLVWLARWLKPLQHCTTPQSRSGNLLLWTSLLSTDSVHALLRITSTWRQVRSVQNVYLLHTYVLDMIVFKAVQSSPPKLTLGYTDWDETSYYDIDGLSAVVHAWSSIIDLKPCPHCRRKVRLSPKTGRQRRNLATVALFCDSLTFLRSRCFRRQIIVALFCDSVDMAFRVHGIVPLKQIVDVHIVSSCQLTRC